jgi:hypothetical protein
MGSQLQLDFFAQNTNRAAPLGITQPISTSPLLLPGNIKSLGDVSSEFYRSMEGCLCAGEQDAGDWYQLMFSLSMVNVGLDEDSGFPICRCHPQYLNATSTCQKQFYTFWLIQHEFSNLTAS